MAAQSHARAAVAGLRPCRRADGWTAIAAGTGRSAKRSYLAFKGPRRVVPLFSASDRDRVLRDAQERLADTVDAINRGEFPPSPDDVYRCETCEFSAVCRKDYVGDV